MTATNLAQLLSMMIADHPSTLDSHGQWNSDLPVFGGPPADGEGVWSWDATHMLVGTCADDLELVRRTPVGPLGEYFFDSWGALWMCCSADYGRAEAFGPSGAACRMSLENVGIDSVPNITAWRQMFDAGRVKEADGWSFLTREGAR
jgi:hypothetical protein